MAKSQSIQKIGSRIQTVLAIGLISLSFGFKEAGAADPQFTVQVDRNSIGLDDSVSLKFSVQAEGTLSTSPPTFYAPDFQEINSYDSSFVESYYDSSTSRISMRNNQTLTKILKPMKTGQLRISKIQVTLNGKAKTAPDVVIQVGPAGSGTPPPRNYGGGGLGLRGAMKRPAGNTVFVRAEVDKEKAYKGEQIIVSYYLYRRVRVLNVQVDQFPMEKGFLREEMEMPVMQPRLDAEAVVLDGAPYQRSLLARYAVYPLEEGKLNIDSMGLKYNYYANAGLNDDGEDPFLQFFQQLTPREATAKSDPVQIDVMPIPADGRPPCFTGGVGDFTISAAVDKYDVRANEAVTLTAKTEGRGNTAAIGEPKATWPPTVELYDSKGTSNLAKAGVSEKVFEILLLPRVPGKVTLPSLELCYFDPSKKQYVKRSTDPIQINVSEAAPGSTPPSKPSTQAGIPTAESPAPSDVKSLRGLKPPSLSDDSWSGVPPWRWMYLFAVMVFSAFAGWAGWDFLGQLRTRGREAASARDRAREKSWGQLQSDAKSAASLPWPEVLRAYEKLCENILEAIDRAYSIGARSLPRAEIRRILIEEKNFDPKRWEQVDRLLEFNEMIRFAGTASTSLEARARNELSGWASAAESVVKSFESALS